LNKTLTTTLLATHEAVDAIEDIFVRPLGRFQLHGKSQALEIVELIANETPKIIDEKHAEFVTASNLFRQGNLNEATTLFENLAQRWNDDGPTRFYVSLCQRRLAEVNHRDWDPTIVIDQK
jgi:adenylate cyclase